MRHISNLPGTSALERLCDEHAGPLFAFLLNFTRDEADTRDLLQVLFIKLAHEPDRLTGVRTERPFRLRLAHNAAVDLMRRRATRDRARDGLAAEINPFAPADDPDGKVFRQDLAAALGELPEDQRAVVHLKLWEGLTFEEIATVLEISPRTAARRYRYGLTVTMQLKWGARPPRAPFESRRSFSEGGFRALAENGEPSDPLSRNHAVGREVVAAPIFVQGEE